MRYFSVLIIIVLTQFTLLAGNNVAKNDSVVIWGKSNEYAGYTLVLEQITNFTSREKAEIVRVPINADGTFRAAFTTSTTIRCFTDLGRYRSFIYVEPGAKYQVTLPPFSVKKDADRFNPYFIPEEMEMGILSGDESQLNQQIRDFDEQFLQQYNQNAMSLFSQSNKKLAEKIKATLETQFPSTENQYFTTHKNFRYARLFALCMSRQKRPLINQFFSNAEVSYSSPAYCDAFNDVFKDFFLYYFSSPAGKELRTAFTMQRSFDTLSIAMKSDTLFLTTRFRETVLLKSLYDSYYTDRYDKKQIIKLVAQASKRCEDSQSQLYANQLLKKLNKLRVGTVAPEINGYNAGGKEISSKNIKSKFVYVNFIHTKNYACKKDLQAVASIASDFKKDLEVVSVITDEEPTDAFAYIKQMGYKWTFIHFNGNGKLLLDYDIKAMPCYYLIDPDGNLIASPAPGPEENFKSRFSEIIRDFNAQKARKDPEQLKTIYDF